MALSDGFFDALVTGAAKVQGDFVQTDPCIVAEDKGLLKAEHGGVIQKSDL